MSATADGKVLFVTDEEQVKLSEVLEDPEAPLIGQSVGSISFVEAWPDDDSVEMTELNISPEILEKLNKNEGKLVLVTTAHYSY